MNGYYQNPATGQITFVGNASLNPQLTQGMTFLGANLPEGYQAGTLPQGATGTNQVNTPGNWVVNPTTGLNEFQPLNFGGGSGGQGQSNQGVQNAGGYNLATDPITSNPQYIQVQNQINALKMQMDAASLAYMNSIETTYNAFIEQQKRINRGLEGSLQQSLIQGGSQRYAQLSSAGIATTQMSFGLSQIAEWEGKKQQAIAQAKLAQEQNNFKLLEFETENIQEFQKKKEAAMKELSDKMAKQNEELKKVERIQSIGDAVSSAISLGLESSNDIYRIVRELDIDATTEEIASAVKNLTIKGEKEEDIKTDFQLFNYFKGKGTLPESIAKLENEGQQYLGFLNVMKLAQSGKLNEAATASGLTETSPGVQGLIPGVGAEGSAVKERLIRDRMFIQFQPLFNKGVLSESDRKIIDEKIAFYRSQGMSEGEILAFFAGFPPDLNTPYDEKLVNTITATTKTSDEHRELINRIGVLLKRGQYTDAVRVVELNAMNYAIEQTKRSGGDVVYENDVAYIKNKTDSITTLLGKGWVNEVGAFTGSFQSWLSKKFGGGEASKIKAKLNSLTADLINKRAGSALTDTEWQRLISGNVPEFKEAAKTWAVKLQELVDDSLEKYNLERALVTLPKLTYDDVLNFSLRLRNYQSGEDNFWGSNKVSGKSIYSPTEGYILPK